MRYFGAMKKTKRMINKTQRLPGDLQENGIQILDYKPEHQQRFKEISEQWITRSYVMEPVDQQVVDHPDKYILNDGGAIVVAKYKGDIAGICALINEGHGIYELTKMAVDEKYR